MAAPLVWLRRSAGTGMGRRFALLIVLFSSIVTLLATALQLSLEYERDVDAIGAQLQQVRVSYGDSLAASLWNTSMSDLDLQLQGIMRLPDLQSIAVVDEQGAPVTGAGAARARDVLELSFPLSYVHRGGALVIGRVHLQASLTGAYRRLRDKVVTILIAQTVKTFLVSLFILVLFQLMVGRHLKKIAAYSDRLAAGQLDAPLRLDRVAARVNERDELAHMVAALNAMHQRVNSTVVGLQESESRWKFALEGAGDGVWDYDVGSDEVFYSRRWKAMLGYEDHELANHLSTFERLAHPDDMRHTMRVLQENIEGRAVNFTSEHRMRCKDGGWKWISSRGMVVERDEHGHATRIIGTHADISTRRAAEDEMARLLAQTEQARAALREANDTMESQVRERTAQLERANKELEAFSYSVSHDLRSPLRGIDGWSLALQEDYGALLDAQGQQYLNRVRGETQRMGHLIDGMLEFSRLGRAEMALRPFDLSALAQTVAARVRDANRERLIEFHIGAGLQAYGDEPLLEAVLHNLLENAAKFSAQRTPARIEFGRADMLEPDSKRRVSALFVRDNGAGFDMQHASKLFGVFQRLHKSSEFPGTGIGLATVQRIVQRHGGAIWADAAPERGATFYFTLKERA